MEWSIDHLRDLAPDELAARLAQSPENQWFDRKSPRIGQTELAKAMVGMANAEGGLLALGFEDGRCVGVDESSKTVNAWRQAAAARTEPPVSARLEFADCRDARGKPARVCLIEVQAGQAVHRTTGDEVYLRVGDSNMLQHFEQRLALHYDRSDTSFEQRPAAPFGSDDLDEDLIAAYLAEIGETRREAHLRTRKFLTPEGGATVAGVLMFGAFPQAGFPNAHVRVLRFLGVEQRYGADQNLVFDRRCEGALPAQVEAAEAAIAEQQPKRRALGADGKFEWIPLLPEAAWKEALVNAVIHRAYSNFGDHVRVSIYDDRIEVFSPGRFPGLAAPSDLPNVVRFARNPQIARSMAELSYGEEIGEGLRRMIREMEAQGRPPPIVEQASGAVSVTLLIAPGMPGALAGAPKEAVALYGRLAASGGEGLRTGELARTARISAPTARKRLRLLEELGAVRRTGSGPQDPRSRWVAIQDG